MKTNNRIDDNFSVCEDGSGKCGLGLTVCREELPSLELDDKFREGTESTSLAVISSLVACVLGQLGKTKAVDDPVVLVDKNGWLQMVKLNADYIKEHGEIVDTTMGVYGLVESVGGDILLPYDEKDPTDV